MNDFIKVGRPGSFGSRKEEIIQNYNTVYGENKWRLRHYINDQPISLPGVLALYEDAYYTYFSKHPYELDWIVSTYADVYDNNPSNFFSGYDYSIQDFEGNHFQDVAIRRVLLRFGKKFKGKELLEVRSNAPGKKWSPGKIPFHKSEFLIQPELKGWWQQGSLESWYQSSKYLEVLDWDKDCRFKGNDITFVTSNSGKAKEATEALKNVTRISSFKLNIKEEQNTSKQIAIHKAKVAYAVLCHPIIVDDSGFSIPKLNGYPGHHVGRELREHGLEHFLNLAKEYGPLESYWDQVVAYMDETLPKPALFISEVHGNLISQAKDGPSTKRLKSELGRAFIINGLAKTIAELTEEEYNKYARTDCWRELRDYLKTKRDLF